MTKETCCPAKKKACHPAFPCAPANLQLVSAILMWKSLQLVSAILMWKSLQLVSAILMWKS